MSKAMDWKYYAKQLEEIIESIELKESTRILVDALVKQAKERSKLKEGVEQ